MALEYNLYLTQTIPTKAFIDEVLLDNNMPYSHHEILKSGCFSITEFMDKYGFSFDCMVTDNPFPLDFPPVPHEIWLSYVFNFTLSKSYSGDSVEVEERILRLCLSILARTQEEAVLTFQFYTCLHRPQTPDAPLQIGLEGGLWDTPTGRAFLAQTPHEFFSDEQ
jgi:hypothetical protein